MEQFSHTTLHSINQLFFSFLFLYCSLALILSPYRYLFTFVCTPFRSLTATLYTSTVQRENLFHSCLKRIYCMYPYMQLAITDRGTFPPPPHPTPSHAGWDRAAGLGSLCALNTNMGGGGIYLRQSAYVDEISKVQRKLPRRSIGKIYINLQQRRNCSAGQSLKKRIYGT